MCCVFSLLLSISITHTAAFHQLPHAITDKDKSETREGKEKEEEKERKEREMFCIEFSWQEKTTWSGIFNSQRERKRELEGAEERERE